MASLIKTSKLVKSILEDDPKARNNDDYLYWAVCNKINPTAAIYKAFTEIMFNRKEYGFPPFESVRRSRQKVQSEFPHLGADNKVKAWRTATEGEYRAFALDREVLNNG